MAETPVSLSLVIIQLSVRSYKNNINKKKGKRSDSVP